MCCDDRNKCELSGLVDSGTEVSVANSDAMKSLSPYGIGTISLLFIKYLLLYSNL